VPQDSAVAFLGTHGRTHMRVHARIHAHTDTHTRVHTHRHTHTRTRTHALTHALTHVRPPLTSSLQKCRTSSKPVMVTMASLLHRMRGSFPAAGEYVCVSGLSPRKLITAQKRWTTRPSSPPYRHLILSRKCPVRTGGRDGGVVADEHGKRDV
jgi:hypothetical protein